MTLQSFLTFFTATVLSLGLVSAQEYQTVLFSAEPGDQPVILKPGEAIRSNITFPSRDFPTSKMIRIKGGTLMPGDFKSRGETNFRRWEYFIDDFLDTVHVRSDKYALLFRGDDDAFPREACFRIPETLLNEGKAEINIQVKRNNFQVKKPEHFGVYLELFFKKEGRSPHDIYDSPDARLFMPIPSDNSIEFREISQTFDLPSGIAAALVVVGGKHFSGDCFVEAPRIIQHGEEIFHVPFVKYSDKESDFNYWVGRNLVSRNWPLWRLEMDGKTIFEDHIFDRASNVADFYMPVPGNISSDNQLTLRLLDEPNVTSFPYEIRSIELIEQPAGDLEVISTPRFIPANKIFALLIETHRPELKLRFETSEGLTPLLKEQVIEEPGLHVIRFRAEDPGTNRSVTIHYEGQTKVVDIGQVVMKNGPDVWLSNGDDIYVDMTDPAYSHFFKWFIKERIGNFFQFRPSYQWSGLRNPDPTVVKKYLGLLQDLDVPYAWQVEGRTLAGNMLNPPVEELSSPLFHGKQAHENDGGYYYWQHFHYEGLYSDMAARARPYGGIFAKHRPIYTEKGTFIHYDPWKVRDMGDGAGYLVRNLNYSKGESTRHTGPSSLFRYLYQAGYDWLGAEQMYGPEETILSSLRGASRAYEKTEFGSLHAMQWGSRPYTDPKHAHRFFLSLATAYMHGSSHINTEDALWTDEYGNDRFSDAGQRHIEVQQKMLDFIETHQRQGQMVTDIALIQGRNCGWKSFGRTSLWSQKGEKWKFNEAMESFDLIKVFYPQNIINSCGPEGWFTNTPFGAVDLLPVETAAGVLGKYQTLIFLGWNTFNEQDFKRIRNFVADGGTVILSRAHLNEELQPDFPPRLPENDNIIRELLGEDYKKLNGKIEIPFGKGKIIYFPDPVYPANEAIRNAYRESVREEGEKHSRAQFNKGWISPGEKVSFTVWDNGNKRTLYLLNIDWSSPENSTPAKFHLGNSVFDIPVQSYLLETIHVRDNLGIMPKATTTDILSIEPDDQGWEVSVQTTGADTLQIFRGDTGYSSVQEIKTAGIHRLRIDSDNGGR